MAEQNLSAFIWSVADLLRGDYKQSEYGKVILPFTVLRRLDCVLEPTKAAQDDLDALVIFRADMGSYLRLYTFLSQVFDYASRQVGSAGAWGVTPTGSGSVRSPQGRRRVATLSAAG